MGCINLNAEINPKILKAIDEDDVDETTKKFIKEALELEYEVYDRNNPKMMPKYAKLMEEFEDDIL